MKEHQIENTDFIKNDAAIQPSVDGADKALNLCLR